MEAGLPNIEGKIKNVWKAIETHEGCFKRESGTSNASALGRSASSNVIFDASLYNPEIYGNSNTVTPKSLTTSLLIKY